MGYDKPDLYYNPDKFGLTTVGEIEWRDESYQFDLTAVWRDAEGTLYWADDHGCSCPTPFEDFTSLEDATTGSLGELLRHLASRAACVINDQYVNDRQGALVTDRAARLFARLIETRP